MLNRLALGCLGLFGFVFAAVTYPNGGILVALAPFCLSMLIATTAIGAGAIVDAVNKHREGVLESNEKLLRAIERMNQTPLAQPETEPANQAGPHPRSWEAMSGRGRIEPKP